jgi:N-acetylmuramoyl-L-alanine amidase
MKLSKLAGYLLCMAVVFGLSAQSARAVADRDIPVDLVVNGEYIKTDARPFIDYDTTYVPIRFVSEALGADRVEWDPQRAKVSVQDEKKIQLTIGSAYAMVDGKRVKMQGAARIVQDRCFVPVRFISETLGARVNWDGTYYEVKIEKSNQTVPQEMILKKEYDKEDTLWLGRIIHAESGGEPFAGKVAVGNVILNRVQSREYPNTIYDVIFDRKYGVQFEPTMNGAIYNTPSSHSMIAAKRALEGHSEAGRSLYFLNPRIATNFWIVNNRTFHRRIANHDFYL